MNDDDKPGASHEQPASATLHEADCRRLLAEHSVGRLGFDDGQPQIRPVNYVLAGDSIVMRTHRRLPPRTPVTFEVDEIDEADRQGWSVIVEGAAISTPLAEFDSDIVARLEPWSPEDTPWVTVVHIATITGLWLRAGRGPHQPDERGYL